MSVTNTGKEMTDCIIKAESFSADHFFIWVPESNFQRCTKNLGLAKGRFIFTEGQIDSRYTIEPKCGFRIPNIQSWIETFLANFYTWDIKTMNETASRQHFLKIYHIIEVLDLFSLLCYFFKFLYSIIEILAFLCLKNKRCYLL